MNQDEILEAGKRVKAILPTIGQGALAILIAKVADMDFETIEWMLSPLYFEPIKVGDKQVGRRGGIYTIIAEFYHDDLHYFVGKSDETFCVMTEYEWNRMGEFYAPGKQDADDRCGISTSQTGVKQTAAQLLEHLTKQGVSNG